MKKKVSCGLQGTEWVESMWFDLYSAEERLQLTVADPLGWCREDWVVVRVGCLGDPVHDTTSGSPPRTAWARPGHHTARWMILTGPYNRPVHCAVDSDPLSEVNQKVQNKHIFSFLLNHELKLHCFYSEIIFIRT